jgi:hypothetical protein
MRLNGLSLSALVGAALLAGCGYPGEPLPPALNRPVRVADLTAVQRGAKVYVQFTVPSVTTENLPLRGKPDIELRLGPAAAEGFSLPAWEKSSERVPDAEIHLDSQPISPVSRKKKGNAPPQPTERYNASAQLDASKFYGKTVLIGVRVHGSKGQDVGWSRLESVQLVPALPVPEALSASNAPDAIRLDWHAAAPEYRVFRKGPTDTAFRQIGTSDKPFYIDSTIEYGKTYDYLVQSVEKTGERYAESEPSAGITFKPVDTFPPAIPTGLTAVPGSRTIELVWDRNAEKDFASYTVARDGKKIAEGLSSPSFSDRDVKPGTRYRYQISATDTAGNSSPLSASVETVIP